MIKLKKMVVGKPFGVGLRSPAVSSLSLLCLSVPWNPTVLCVLLLCVCLYIPAWVACKRADAVSEENRKLHHLPDNSPHDRYLYAVTVHTGLCSAQCMSAKVKHYAPYLTDQSTFKGAFCPV